LKLLRWQQISFLGKKEFLGVQGRWVTVWWRLSGHLVNMRMFSNRRDEKDSKDYK